MPRTRNWILCLLLVCALCTLNASAEPGSKRYDRISFTNFSMVPVDDVRVELLDQYGVPFGSCPPGGFMLGTVQPGQGVEMDLYEDIPGKWVTKAVCSLIWAGGPAGNVIEVAPEQSLAQTGFRFLQPLPPVGVVEGEGLTGDGQIVIGCP